MWFHCELSLVTPLFKILPTALDKVMSKHFLGHLDEFKSGIENITTYLERVDLFIAANEAPNDKKVAVLLC